MSFFIPVSYTHLNKRAGFTKEDDRLPKWMTEEAIPENGSVFDVSEDVLDHIFDGIE